MTLCSSKVCDQGTGDSHKPLEEARALVNALIKVVACYRHLSSCIGGCTDGVQLRNELRQTREQAQRLALENRQVLTARLRDKTLPEDERLEMELLWVSFTSSLELFHADMCRVFSVGQKFPLSFKSSTLVQTGLQGETTNVTARALSVTELNSNEVPAALEHVEQRDLELEVACMDQMLEDMEQQVNVLRWMVEARGPQFAEAQGNGSSLVLLNAIEEESQQHTFGGDPLLMVLSSGLVITITIILMLVYLVYFH